MLLMDITISTYFKYVFIAFGAVTALIAAFFSIRKFYQWLRPVRIKPSCYFDGSGPGTVRATIINTSSESLYIVRCDARGTYSFRRIAFTHLRKPFIPPRLYPVVRFGAVYYTLLNEHRKIEPFEPAKLEYKLVDAPLNGLLTPYFLIEVELSNGRIFRSSKMRTPKKWQFLGMPLDKLPNKGVERTG